jgi:hypothetical protein
MVIEYSSDINNGESIRGEAIISGRHGFDGRSGDRRFNRECDGFSSDRNAGFEFGRCDIDSSDFSAFRSHGFIDDRESGRRRIRSFGRSRRGRVARFEVAREMGLRQMLDVAEEGHDSECMRVCCEESRRMISFLSQCGGKWSRR